MKKLNNEEILEQLLIRNGDCSALWSPREGDFSLNAEAFRNCMGQWNDMEFFFPEVDLRKYIRMNEWTRDDFSFENEQIVMENLPKYMHDIFHEMKEFRDNPRNELTSIQEIYARMVGWPMKTQDEKAFCAYNYTFQRYFKNSTLHKNEGEQNDTENT